MNRANYIAEFGYEIIEGNELLKKMGYDLRYDYCINYADPAEIKCEEVGKFIELPKYMWN